MSRVWSVNRDVKAETPTPCINQSEISILQPIRSEYYLHQHAQSSQITHHHPVVFCAEFELFHRNNREHALKHNKSNASTNQNLVFLFVDQSEESIFMSTNQKRDYLEDTQRYTTNSLDQHQSSYSRQSQQTKNLLHIKYCSLALLLLWFLKL